MELTGERGDPDALELQAGQATLAEAHAALYETYSDDVRQDVGAAPEGAGGEPGDETENPNDVERDEADGPCMLDGKTSSEAIRGGDDSELNKSVPYEGSVGLGVDIVEIERMAHILEHASSFAARVFSEDERAYCDGKSKPATHYALRFAAKEAVVKALGTGFSDGIGVRDIEVQRTKRGKPTVVLTGRAKEIAQEQGVRDISISLSYTHSEAVACAMAITESSIRATEKRKDPMEELTRQFKEVRGMLDDL